MIKEIEGIKKVKKVGKLSGRRRRTLKGMYYSKLISKIYMGGENIKRSVEKECIDEKKPVKENFSKEEHILDKYI